MGEAEYTFAQARARLEDIVGQVRKKDLSLERSLDLLEEGVRLANVCTEQIDQSEWRAVAEELQAEADTTESALSDESEDRTDSAGRLDADLGDDDGELEPVAEQ